MQLNNLAMLAIKTNFFVHNFQFFIGHMIYIYIYMHIYILSSLIYIKNINSYFAAALFSNKDLFTYDMLKKKKKKEGVA